MRLVGIGYASEGVVKRLEVALASFFCVDRRSWREGGRAGGKAVEEVGRDGGERREGRGMSWWLIYKVAK